MTNYQEPDGAAESLLMIELVQAAEQKLLQLRSVETATGLSIWTKLIPTDPFRPESAAENLPEQGSISRFRSILGEEGFTRNLEIDDLKSLSNFAGDHSVRIFAKDADDWICRVDDQIHLQ